MNYAVEAVVLLIDNDISLRRLLRQPLQDAGYRFREAESAEEGLQKILCDSPDLVLLGLERSILVEVIRKIRAASNVPLIVLSETGDERMSISCLDAGADNFLVKPFGVAELLARARVALRHQGIFTREPNSGKLDIGGVSIDLASRSVLRNGVPTHLARLEYKLLALLAKYPGRLLSYEFLIWEIWGHSTAEGHHRLRIYMTNLRKKLEQDSSSPEFLLTEPGVGYRLKI